jgi:Holliday junction resolvase
MQRRKGQVAEREIFALLSEDLGAVVKRRILQAREGGCDSLDIPQWAIEVKRHETLNLKEWWSQTIRQANAVQRKPILFYRQSRQPWRACIDLHDMNPDKFPVRGREYGIVSFDAACQFLREGLEGDA